MFKGYACRFQACPCDAGSGFAMPGEASHGFFPFHNLSQFRHGTAKRGFARRGRAWQGNSWYFSHFSNAGRGRGIRAMSGWVRHGGAVFGAAGLGSEWHGNISWR